RTYRCPRRSRRSNRRAPSPRSAPREARHGRACPLRRGPWPAVPLPPSDPVRPQLRPVGPLPRLLVLVEVVRVWVGALVGVFDDVADLGVDLLADTLEVLLVREPALLQLVLKGDDRVRLPILLLILRRAVLVGVDHRVAPEAVAERRDEARHRVVTG